MFDVMRGILGKLDAEYADLRHEVRRDVDITLSRHDFSHVGENSADGYVLRVLDRGGLASIAFTRPEDADEAARTAVENARLLGSRIDKPIAFANTDVVVDTVRPELAEDPRDVDLDEKLALMRAYGAIPLAHEGIATVDLVYREIVREKHFVSTEGTEIREDLVTTGILGQIVSREGSLTQNVRVGMGGADGFQNVRDQEPHLGARTRMALDLLRARPARAGTYDCVLNPHLAGVFAHEAFGHRSEADGVEKRPLIREKMKIGAKLGSDVVTIVDDATIPGQLGFYLYDDEGVAVRRRPLMESGVLTGRLHSRKTAASFDEPLSGHAVAEDYRYPPIVRMGCIIIEPGLSTFDELLEGLGDGLYVLDAKGGQTSGENFTFGAQAAYEVRGGKLAGMVRDLNIAGNLYRTLMDIESVGADLTFTKAGSCGKGQSNPRSCQGSPHVLIRNLVAGGV